ncbi:MAG: DUF4352 domain-containing protein [Pyrinomonadaceae bacterium]
MGVLMMLMTVGGLIFAVVLLTIAFWTKKSWLKHFVFGGVTVWFIAYAFLFFTASFFSQEQTLGFNEPKEFCGFYFDCHMHTAVTDMQKTKTFGGKTATGEFYIVKIKVSSDAKREPLNLTAPNFEVLDESGKRYPRDTSLEKPEPSWEEKVPAGGSFEKEIVFDLPENVQNPRLDASEGYGVDKVIEAVLIGDEDSIGHKRAFFKLENSQQTAHLQ